MGLPPRGEKIGDLAFRDLCHGWWYEIPVKGFLGSPLPGTVEGTEATLWRPGNTTVASTALVCRAWGVSRFDQ